MANKLNILRWEPEQSIRPPAGVAKGGTLEGWQTAVEAALAVQDCPHWTLGAASGVVGPLLALCDFPTCGINFSGPTSRGKTTAVALGVSVWSSPRLTSGGLLRSMNTTQNAIELTARQSNHMILGLDELAHCDGKTVGHTIYFLSGGTGKARMSPDLMPRPTHTWQTFVLLSSERSLAQKINGDGGQWTGGMAVRFPDVDCSEVDASVRRDTLTKITGIYRHYGHVGGAFWDALTEAGLVSREPDKLRSRVIAAAEKLAGEHADGAKHRAALPFALIGVAGGLAQKFGFLPESAKITKAVNWGWERNASSLEARALNPTGQALGNLRHWIAAHWDVAIKHVDTPYKTSRDAVGWYDDDAIYIPVVCITEAIDGVLSVPAFARLLRKSELLSDWTDDRRAAIRRVPKVGKVDAYALKKTEFRE